MQVEKVASSCNSNGELAAPLNGLKPSESSDLLVEVQSLRKHKEWADRKIDLLIKRVRDAEGPQKLLTDEVQQLRLVICSASC